MIATYVALWSRPDHLCSYTMHNQDYGEARSLTYTNLNSRTVCVETMKLYQVDVKIKINLLMR